MPRNTPRPSVKGQRRDQGPADATEAESSTTVVGLREQRRTLRVEMSREHILNVAETLFGNQGYQATSLEQVAAGSEYSVGAVYKFFANKRDLLDAVMTRRFAEMRDTVDGILADSRSGLDELLALCEYYLDYFRLQPEFGRLTLRVYPAGLETVPDFAQYRENSKEGTDLLVRALRTGQREGTVREVNPAWLATLVRGLIMFHHSMASELAPAEVPVSELLEVVRNSVSPVQPPVTASRAAKAR
ncbi:TetR/AcrR family transcriptional regulator [Jatrophihabitans sp. DSM 45814]